LIKRRRGGKKEIGRRREKEIGSRS